MLARRGLVNTFSVFNSNLRPGLDRLYWRNRKSMIDAFIYFSLYFFTDIEGNASDTAVNWYDAFGQFITKVRMEN